MATLLCVSTSLSAQFRPTVNLNCVHTNALAFVAANALPNTVINIKGACTGPISITANGLQLNAVGAASISGDGKNAVTVTGAQRVTLAAPFRHSRTACTGFR